MDNGSQEPQGVITALEVQKRNKHRVNVYLDGEYAFSLSLDDAARLHKGQRLSAAEAAALRGDDEISRAVDSALRFLAVRPRSEHEVRQNLLHKTMPPPVIDAAVERLRTLGYLDDHAFAAFWVRDRSTFKPISPRALRYELRQKGVADRLIDELLAEVDAGDSAYRAAESQARRLRGSDHAAFRKKLLAFLQRRGFAYGEARAAIERLAEALEDEDPDYFISTAADGDVLPDGEDELC